jgi:hypothetical protein
VVKIDLLHRESRISLTDLDACCKSL